MGRSSTTHHPMPLTRCDSIWPLQLSMTKCRNMYTVCNYCVLTQNLKHCPVGNKITYTGTWHVKLVEKTIENDAKEWTAKGLTIFYASVQISHRRIKTVFWSFLVMFFPLNLVKDPYYGKNSLITDSLVLWFQGATARQLPKSNHLLVLWWSTLTMEKRWILLNPSQQRT